MIEYYRVPYVKKFSIGDLLSDAFPIWAYANNRGLHIWLKGFSTKRVSRKWYEIVQDSRENSIEEQTNFVPVLVGGAIHSDMRVVERTVGIG